METERKSVLAEYAELAKKYGLPKLEELEKEFDFYIEKEGLVLSQILASIIRRIGQIAGDIEGMLQPSKYCCIFETKFFNEKEREKLFNKYQELQKLFWEILKLRIEDEKAKTDMLKRIITEWKDIKDWSKWFYDKLISGWGNKEEETEKKTYIS